MPSSQTHNLASNKSRWDSKVVDSSDMAKEERTIKQGQMMKPVKAIYSQLTVQRDNSTAGAEHKLAQVMQFKQDLVVNTVIAHATDNEESVTSWVVTDTEKLVNGN